MIAAWDLRSERQSPLAFPPWLSGAVYLIILHVGSAATVTWFRSWHSHGFRSRWKWPAHILHVLHYLTESKQKPPGLSSFSFSDLMAWLFFNHILYYMLCYSCDLSWLSLFPFSLIPFICCLTVSSPLPTLYEPEQTISSQYRSDGYWFLYLCLWKFSMLSRLLTLTCFRHLTLIVLLQTLLRMRVILAPGSACLHFVPQRYGPEPRPTTLTMSWLTFMRVSFSKVPDSQHEARCLGPDPVRNINSCPYSLIAARLECGCSS